MTKGKGGIWSFHTQPLQPEIYYYSFVDGGEPRIDPENQRIVLNLVNPARNAVEVPGQGPQLWDESDVPHGTVHTHTFTSKIARGLPANQEEVVIYTPPGYDAHAAKPYPVLYLLHGWSGVGIGLMFGIWVITLHVPRTLGFYGIPGALTDPDEWSSMFIALGIWGGSWAQAAYSRVERR